MWQCILLYATALALCCCTALAEEPLLCKAKKGAVGVRWYDVDTVDNVLQSKDAAALESAIERGMATRADAPVEVYVTDIHINMRWAFVRPKGRTTQFLVPLTDLDCPR